ncbi:glycoside hydrolase family 9 protein [Glaciecola petra]|uniref:Endoglucanase n=1 Tax=Glaciecola petra TaxID=3075602 RepID=A0ABU2ZU22_9ALTE|nr:glycoside hydrolase family 9 protein [Aestuariibacter sp. P117]MDT0596144.1 glycoside hydrolase family 9 protein [Aestuariibacter sp. P117]
MNKKIRILISAFITSCLIGISACSSITSELTLNDKIGTSNKIKVNQIAYLPNSTKLAVVPFETSENASIESQEQGFRIENASSGEVVFEGTLSTASLWAPANQTAKLADFSELTRPGTYVVKVDGVMQSPSFNISKDGFLATHDAALKAYYFNRAGMALSKEYAGAWQRQAGHLDTDVIVHESAASAARPAGTVISSPKGWYDAGDYNKYIVNSGISTYTLLLAYSHFEDFYETRSIDIPESSNGVPDIIDEIMWNLDWMETMQDPNDGGVYHKLTTKNFMSAVMPHTLTEPRFVVQKSTGAALNFAATFAMASRVLSELPTFTAKANEYKQAATAAYQWAMSHPKAIYKQPEDIKTGEYGDSELKGEFAWAAAELFLLTKDSNYLDNFQQFADELTTPGWQDTMTLAYISLLSEGKTVMKAPDYDVIVEKVLEYSDELVGLKEQSAYGVPMVKSDFVWGSNSVALNKAFVLLQAYRHTSIEKYKTSASSLIDYVMGKNPTDYSYITGFGSKSPMDPHHRVSYADDVNDPVPGFLVGGPHTGEQDKCTYEGSFAATTFLDDWCSYSTNEVTINWNAPLVYTLVALHSMQ